MVVVSVHNEWVSVCRREVRGLSLITIKNISNTYKQKKLFIYMYADWLILATIESSPLDQYVCFSGGILWVYELILTVCWVDSLCIRLCLCWHVSVGY